MTTSPQHFIVPRWRELPLEFDGELLVDISSQEGESQRWQEIRIYRTVRGKFVTEVVGRTTLDEENDILNVKVWRRPEQVRKGLIRRQNDREFYTDLALEAMELADEIVPGIDDPNLTEQI